MLYLRTASGGFVNSATIVQLSPQRGDGTDKITSWVAICGNGKAVALAAYYAAPGRIEEVVDFMPAVERPSGWRARELIASGYSAARSLI
jgi:hypothetical protein